MPKDKTKQEYAQEIQESYNLLMLQVFTAQEHDISVDFDYGYLDDHVRTCTKKTDSQPVSYLNNVLNHIVKQNVTMRHYISEHMRREHPSYALQEAYDGVP